MPYGSIIYEKKGQVAVVTFNRPNRLNAISRQFSQEMDQVLAETNEDDDVRVLILTGGDKVFCAGADLKESQEGGGLRGRVGNRLALFVDRIERHEKPVIAAVAGYAYGGGCEIALACDLRVAAETAKFGVPEIKIGAIPAAGGTQRLPRLIGITKAKELLFSGDPVDAQEAYRLGLVNKVVPLASLMPEAMAMANMLIERPPLSIKALKECVNYGMRIDLDAAIEFEAKWASVLSYTEDMKEGVAAFVEKRRPKFKGR